MAIRGYNSRTTSKNTTRSLSGGRDGNAFVDEQAAILEDKRTKAQSQTSTRPSRQTSAPNVSKRQTSPSRQSQQTSTKQTTAPKVDNFSSPLPNEPIRPTRQDTKSSGLPPLPEEPSYEPNLRVTPATVRADRDVVRRAAGVRPRRNRPSTREEIKQELRDKQGAQAQLADAIAEEIDATIDSQPRNQINPVVRSNQFTQGELVTALGAPYEGFFNELQDGTKLQGRGRIGDVPVITPELLLYDISTIDPSLVQQDEPERGPDFGLTIPSGHPVGVGATHQGPGNQFYNCPREVPVTHPIVQRCIKIDKKVTDELLKQV